MVGVFRLQVDVLPGKAHSKHYFFGVRPALGQAQACADALASIDLGVLRWMARRMREPGYSGRELYETALHGWPKEIAAYGVDRLATELRGLGLDSEAA